MNTDMAIELVRNAMLVAAKVTGPLLLVALAVGVFVGILQAATQVNEASVSFVLKLVAVLATFIVLGGWTIQVMVDYTTRTIGSIADVVR